MYDSSKEVTSLKLKLNNDVLLESFEVFGPNSGTVTLKSKPAVAASGKSSIALSFEATSENGATATDDKDIMVGATAKYTFNAWSTEFDWDAASGEFNANWEILADAKINSLLELNSNQKSTAVAQWKIKSKDLPLALTLSTSFNQAVENLTQAQNITVKYGIQSSATLSYTQESTSITYDGGLGFGYNFTSASDPSTFDTFVNVGVALPVTKRMSIFGKGKLLNRAPASGGGQKTDVEVGAQFGINVLLP
jgi:hypothetical protein